MTSPATPWSGEVYLEEVDRHNRAEHTGTLDTTGHGNGNTARTITRDGYTFAVGPDVSAAAISPAFAPLNPAALPPGHVAGPAPRTAPIY